MKYIRITQRIFGLLSLTWTEGAVMILLTVLYAAFEGFGISLLLPVMQYLESGGNVPPSGGIWTYLTAWSEALGIPLTLGTLLILAFLPILARQIVYFINTWYTAAVQNRATQRLTARAFSAVAHADLAFIEARDQGELLSFLTGQIGRCGQALVLYVKLLGTGFVIAVYAVILGFLSWQLALIAIAAMAIVSWGMRSVLKRSRVYGTELSKVTNETYTAIRERLAALRLVKMRGREDAETDFISGLAGRMRDANTRIAVAGATVEVIVDPLLMLAVFVIVWVGFEAYGLTLASLGLFLFILLRLNAKAKEFNTGRNTLASVMPSFDFVERVLGDAESARTITGGTRQYSPLADVISFQDVSFAYGDADKRALSDVTIEIPRGSLTALVGRSGAGKSTLVDLIPRLRVPVSGQVRLDGTPAGEFDLGSLRRSVGFLTQEAILFNDTIRANLIYGLDPAPADEEIRTALDDSYSSEFVDELPAGLETVIGDRGVRLSGGQRQRLALARVLLQDPDILILDEPTSALDSESEQYIQRAFERIAEDRTVVVIAHRLSTVEKADQIIVLSDGKVVETGAHAELLEKDGHYKRLFDMQIHA